MEPAAAAGRHRRGTLRELRGEGVAFVQRQLSRERFASLGTRLFACSHVSEAFANFPVGGTPEGERNKQEQGPYNFYKVGYRLPLLGHILDAFEMKCKFHN
jgi:hypothetical protein